MAVSSLLGVLMTYSTVLCNSYNSPLATSITGNTKDIVSTLIGEWDSLMPFACRLSDVWGVEGDGWMGGTAPWGRERARESAHSEFVYCCMGTSMHPRPFLDRLPAVYPLRLFPC
jgi:hypothetical protein